MNPINNNLDQIIENVIIENDRIDIINNDHINIIQNQDNNHRNIRAPEHYYLWYCVRHGDCFLTSRNTEPEARNSRCGVLDQCYYDYLGIITLDRNRPRLYIENGIDIRRYFEESNDGYTVDMLDNLVNSPIRRNEAILF